jgi:hypothetical protein
MGGQNIGGVFDYARQGGKAPESFMSDINETRQCFGSSRDAPVKS